MRRYLFVTLLGGVAVCAAAADVAAQEDIYSSPGVRYYVNRTRSQDVPSVGLRATVQRDLNAGRPGGGTAFQPTFLQSSGGGGGGASIEKPFANASHRPTVSPYLNLLREDISDDNVPDYHTLVRPQLQQIQFQQAQQQQNAMVYRQLQQIQARGGMNPQGSEMMLPTGHSTTFQYLAPYYPSRR